MSNRFGFLGLATTMACLGLALVQDVQSGGGGQKAKPQNAVAYAADEDDKENFMRQSPGALTVREATDWGLGPNYVDELKPLPHAGCGGDTPFEIWLYAGRDGSSFGASTLPMPWDDWVEMNVSRKPVLMERVREYMVGRYDFSGRAVTGATMSGGKPIMAGPVARLPEGVASWTELASLSPEKIREDDLFPYKPLAHPLSSTAHMVFPDNWVRTHPEHERMDMDHDFPDAYLPEFPPPLFLTTHKELGDVTGGREVTLANYYEIFDGLLTGEQMEGLKELLRPTATTWFNHTNHRVTIEPSAGVSCFSCHVNGHTNAAFELAPDARPNQSRLRVDTPTMRANFNMMQLSSKRSIRSMDHFSEVEEYFDGDPGSLGQPIGLANRQRQLTNRMGDFNAILDNPPAPKLGPLMKLIPEKATKQELRGETLFHGKAQCSACHYGPQFTDDYMHDLQVERFYVGRPEGPIKTFGLRGIKDSPPYLHDGRLPTLADTVEFFNVIFELDLSCSVRSSSKITVEFFNVIFELDLTEQEREDLVAFLLCL